MQKKIFVIGSYGAGNIGDEAILETIKINFNDFEIIPALPHLPLSFFKVPLRFNILKKLRDSDLVLLGGGGLFTDSDSIEAIKIWGNTIEWANFFDKKVFVYANSVGPFYSKKAEDLTKKYLKMVDKITVRDEISKYCLKKLGIKSDVYSDPVFTYKFTKKGGGVKKIIAISLRNLNKEKFDHKQFEKYLEAKEAMGYKILFAFMEEKDFEVYTKYHKKDGRILVIPKNFTELIEVLEKCETCIGMRLHFLIASALLGKRMLAISYSSKVKGLMDDIGIESLDINEKSFNNIETMFNFPKDVDEQIKKAEALNEEFRKYVEESG